MGQATNDIVITSVSTEPDAFVKETIKLLDEASKAVGQSFQDEPVNFRATDGDGNFAGGLSGEVLQGWLYIRFLAVRPDLRSSGIGAKLLEKAHELAKSRRLAGVYVDTFDFQAPKFYLREGFTEIGRLPSVNGLPQRIWFVKVNEDAGSDR
ncbi:GNAT family N-acetyltransferase [Rhizobium sp. L1K21]|uniref:GNAT family N-acetyltransferase n=1 Tax=Rhizobium sp. L1K21 TaxID=2954933 RepID=UPI002092B434|nr:GNAT family N-acetyltransferase [Rhizobium sp. L1K21]MCO6185788.1 GNAT family N-acetyltransferase [Rhizobium sp. L1K21]